MVFLAALPTIVKLVMVGVTGTSVMDGITTPDDNNSNATLGIFQGVPRAHQLPHQATKHFSMPGCSTNNFRHGYQCCTSYQWQSYNGTIGVDLTNTGIPIILH